MCLTTVLVGSWIILVRGTDLKGASGSTWRRSWGRCWSGWMKTQVVSDCGRIHSAGGQRFFRRTEEFSFGVTFDLCVLRRPTPKWRSEQTKMADQHCCCCPGVWGRKVSFCVNFCWSFSFIFIWFYLNNLLFFFLCPLNFSLGNLLSFLLPSHSFVARSWLI